MEIKQKYLDMCCMRTLDASIAIYGDVLDTYYTFYDTFLIQSDRRVLQYLRECSLGIETTLSYEEYIELETIREQCVEEIRKLKHLTTEKE